MADIVSTAIGIYGMLKIPFQLLDAGVKLLGRILVHVKATQVQVPGETALRDIRKKERITLPVSTKTATLRGTYLLHPRAANYVVFISKNTMFWPQGEIVFRKHSWDAQITFDGPGTHYVIVAKLSPEIMVLYRYYWDFSRQLETHKKEIEDKLPEQYKKVTEALRLWRGTPIPGDITGFTNLQEMEFVLQ